MDKIDAEWKATYPNLKSVDNASSTEKILHFAWKHKEDHSRRIYERGRLDAHAFSIMVKQVIRLDNWQRKSYDGNNNRENDRITPFRFMTYQDTQHKKHQPTSEWPRI